MKLKIDFVNILLIVAILFVLILWLVSCNPVKQVINDKAKLDKVAEEVIRQGYCANDTTIIVKSDTLLVVDSLLEIRSDTTIINDTAYITLWETKNFFKTFTIHDTIRSVVVDNARVNLLQADLNKISKESEEHKQKATHRLYWFIIACAIILFLILCKIR
jgi:uncharacterized membrane protein affecting hemolysin expression